MNLKKQWARSGNDFKIADTVDIIEKLPIGVYKVVKDPFGNIYLTKSGDNFNFSHKIYGCETKFINRVVTSYKNTKGNMGILLNGVKGTGKTVTAELIANEIQLPVLIVSEFNAQLPNFINNIQQDIIVFFDEFEKIYTDYNANVLTIMDGVLNNDFRKMFLLTTNDLYINANLLQRPGRIRYIKTFTQLPVETIQEIVKDKLIHTKWNDSIIKFISELETITIDIVKAIVDEVNIHDEDPINFKDVFNVKKLEAHWNVYEVIKEKDKDPVEKLVYAKADIFPKKITSREANVNATFKVNGKAIGYIESILNDEIFSVTNFKDDEEDRVFRVEPIIGTHHLFTNYVF